MDALESVAREVAGVNLKSRITHFDLALVPKQTLSLFTILDQPVYAMWFIQPSQRSLPTASNPSFT